MISNGIKTEQFTGATSHANEVAARNAGELSVAEALPALEVPWGGATFLAELDTILEDGNSFGNNSARSAAADVANLMKDIFSRGTTSNSRHQLRARLLLSPLLANRSGAHDLDPRLRVALKDWTHHVHAAAEAQQHKQSLTATSSQPQLQQSTQLMSESTFAASVMHQYYNPSSAGLVSSGALTETCAAMQKSWKAFDAKLQREYEQGERPGDHHHHRTDAELAALRGALAERLREPIHGSSQGKSARHLAGGGGGEDDSAWCSSSFEPPCPLLASSRGSSGNATADHVAWASMDCSHRLMRVVAVEPPTTTTLPAVGTSTIATQKIITPSTTPLKDDRVATRAFPPPPSRPVVFAMPTEDEVEEDVGLQAALRKSRAAAQLYDDEEGLWPAPPPSSRLPSHTSHLQHTTAGSSSSHHNPTSSMTTTSMMRLHTPKLDDATILAPHQMMVFEHGQLVVKDRPKPKAPRQKVPPRPAAAGTQQPASATPQRAPEHHEEPSTNTTIPVNKDDEESGATTAIMQTPQMPKLLTRDEVAWLINRLPATYQRAKDVLLIGLEDHKFRVR